MIAAGPPSWSTPSGAVLDARPRAIDFAPPFRARYCLYVNLVPGAAGAAPSASSRPAAPRGYPYGRFLWGELSIGASNCGALRARLICISTMSLVARRIAIWPDVELHWDQCEQCASQFPLPARQLGPDRMRRNMYDRIRNDPENREREMLFGGGAASDVSAVNRLIPRVREKSGG